MVRKERQKMSKTWILVFKSTIALSQLANEIKKAVRTLLLQWN